MMQTSILFLSIILLPVSSYQFEDSGRATIEAAPRFQSVVSLDHTVYLGDRLRMRCAAIGEPTPDVFWYRRRVPLTEEKIKDQRIEVDHDHMFIDIKRLEAQDQGEWSCLVGNRHGNISRNFKLKIIDPIKMLNMIGEKGFDLVPITLTKLFTGEGRARVERAMIGWKQLDETGRRQRAIALIEETRAAKDAEYNAEDARNAAEMQRMRQSSRPKIQLGRASKTRQSTERILEDPRKRMAPFFIDDLEYSKSISSPAGRTIKMSCAAGGAPAPMYTWYKDEVLLTSSSTRSTGAEYKMKGHLLELEDVTESDQGVYRCKVINSKGELSRRFNVSVVARMRTKPIIVPNILVNQTVTVNETAVFRCKVISDLIPHIIWLRIDPTRNGHYHLYDETTKTFEFNYTEIESVPNAHITSMGQESILELREVQLADRGLYVCVTGNSMGKVMENATLTVSEFPIVTAIETHPSNLGSFSIVGLSLFAALVLLALVIAALLLLVQQKHLRKSPIKRRLMMVARKVNKDPKTHKGDLPSSYTVQIVEKDENGREIKKRPWLNSDTTSFTDFEVETDPVWEIDRERLRLLERIGEGAFGVVWRGVYKKVDNDGGSQDLPVAVKRLKESAQQKELVDLFSEAQMFKIIGRHENVLGLIGCCTGAGPLFVVLELCEHGNLRDFLRAHRPRDQRECPAKPLPALEDGEYLQPRRKMNECVIADLTQRHLVEWAWQVAKGMKYMASLKIIHRDLAARNVLVTGDFTMKISDFGLSRDVYSDNYYRRKGAGRLPIKWMALEALDSHVYTVESDVWSFGILLWEIMTLGGTPYPTIAMPQLYSCLKDGYRMESPHNCPEEIYNIMVGCWQELIDRRPSFETIVDYLEWMLEEGAERCTEESKLTRETTLDYETDAGCFSDSSNGTMETQRVASRMAKRPLSTAVILPSEPAHAICDDDDEEEAPGRPAPPVRSFVRPSASTMTSSRSPPFPLSFSAESAKTGVESRSQAPSRWMP